MNHSGSSTAAARESAPATRPPHPFKWAVLGLLIVLMWQAVTVHANYDGDWSGLFRTGSATSVPPRLAGTTHRDASPAGYDGQFYRFLAHDPLLRSDTAKYMDAPALRARRILLPLAAWTVALGRPGLTDGAYVLVIALFIFSGVYWLSRLMVLQGRHASLGLLFLAVPATVISIDRMTVDVAVAALAAGFALYTFEEREAELWFVLAAAGLVRETGLLLGGACALAALFRRDFRRSALRASAALPALLWYGYVHWALRGISSGSVRSIPAWAIPRLELGIVLRALDPPRYALPPLLETIARGLDVAALIGMAAAAALAASHLRATRPTALRIALALQILLLLAMTREAFWDTPFGYGRVFGPLFILLLAAAGSRAGTAAVLGATLAIALVDLRLATELKAQVLGVLYWAACW